MTGTGCESHSKTSHMNMPSVLCMNMPSEKFVISASEQIADHGVHCILVSSYGSGILADQAELFINGCFSILIMLE